MKRLTYIGCGVSTVFSVIKLLDHGYDGELITIIDAGNNPYNRKREEVMNGFLGAGGYSDGKIIYSFNQGGNLLEYTGEEKGIELMKELKHYIRQFHPDISKIKTTGIAPIPVFLKDSDLVMRQSECEHIGTDYLEQIGKNIYDYFMTCGVKMFFNVEVLNINFDEKKLYLINDRAYSHTYEKLVIATGKSGMVFINQLIKQYNLPNKTKAAQIGVRFETEHKYFKKLADDFHDFKLYKKFNEEVSCRTFCSNNIAAYVAMEDVNGMKSYNGHGYKDETKNNGLTNFGILLEVKGVKNPLLFTQKLVKKCQTGNRGLYYTPGYRKPTVDATLCHRSEFISIYGEYANTILEFIDKLNQIFKFENDYVIYLPEVKLLTNEIIVNTGDLSLKQYPDVHIVGDALSARGIFVSASQGMYLAESFLR